MQEGGPNVYPGVLHDYTNLVSLTGTVLLPSPLLPEENHSYSCTSPRQKERVQWVRTMGAVEWWFTYLKYDM